MRRIVTCFTVAGLCLGLLAAPAMAAPKSAEVLELDCGAAGTVAILVQFNSSGAALFDASLETNGRAGVLSSLDGRAYIGEHGEEPASEPDFAFAKEYGKRNGYSTMKTCNVSLVESDDFGTFTVFFTVVIATK